MERLGVALEHNRMELALKPAKHLESLLVRPSVIEQFLISQIMFEYAFPVFVLQLRQCDPLATSISLLLIDLKVFWNTLDELVFNRLCVRFFDLPTFLSGILSFRGTTMHG